MVVDLCAPLLAFVIATLRTIGHGSCGESVVVREEQGVLVGWLVNGVPNHTPIYTLHPMNWHMFKLIVQGHSKGFRGCFVPRRTQHGHSTRGLCVFKTHMKISFSFFRHCLLGRVWREEFVDV